MLKPQSRDKDRLAMLMRPMRLIKRRREPPRRGVMRTEAYAALHSRTILGLAGRIVKMGAIHMRAEAAGRLRCELSARLCRLCILLPQTINLPELSIPKAFGMQTSPGTSGRVTKGRRCFTKCRYCRGKKCKVSQLVHSDCMRSSAKPTFEQTAHLPPRGTPL